MATRDVPVLSLVVVTSFIGLCSQNNCTRGELDSEVENQCPRGYAWKCNNIGLNTVPTTYPNNNDTNKLCLLDLSWNNISNITGSPFKNITDVLWLWLFHNRLIWIDSGAFVGLNNLVYLKLSSNLLELPRSFAGDVFKPLINLRILNLKNNSIKSYDGLQELLQGLKHLEGFLMTGCYNCTFGRGFEDSGQANSDSCNISTLLNRTFIHLPHIKKLFMSFCGIKNVEADALSWLKNIEILDISYNTALNFKGMHNVLYDLANSSLRILDVFVCLYVLRFYGPVNPIGSCRARSVYLTTRLLGRLSPLSG